MRVTLRELANKAGVSVSTVSRVLTNSNHPISADTRQHILALARELGYRPNMAGRSLRTDKSFSIGIIVDNICSPFTPPIIRGIQDHLKKPGYSSLILNGDGDQETEIEAVRDLVSRSIDGIIFVESWLREAGPSLELAGKPCVFVHHLFGAGHRNSVLVDERFGAQLAVKHLLSSGHRRIAHVSGPEGWRATTERLSAYRDVLAEHSIPYDPLLVEEGDWELQSGVRAARKLMALPQRPTAIFAANDRMALGAIYATQEVGLRVPGDVAVVGYDDQELASLSRPTITSVTLPCNELGKASAELLLALLEEPDLDVQPIEVRGRLVLRESSGAEEGQTGLDRYETHVTPRQLLTKRQEG